MAKAKGSPKTGGAVKGTKYKKTIAWEQLGEFITQGAAHRVIEIMTDPNLPPEKFMQYFQGNLNYFKPQLARTETQGEQEITIKFKRTVDGSEPGI
jgi:hypothetical protein